MNTDGTHGNAADEHDATPGAQRAPAWLSDTVERLESDDRWDPVVEALAGASQPLTEGPGGSMLRGDWLGHALHPMMTDLPLGCWTSTSILDLIGGRASRKAARRLVGIGVLASVPTALTGLVELASIEDQRIRRIAAVHASGNTVALALYLSSYRARRREHHFRGTLLALAGGSMAAFTGYLGGHMSFARKVGTGPRGLEDDVSRQHSNGSQPAASADAPTGTASSGSGAVWTPQPPVAEVSGTGHTDLMGVDQVAHELTVPVAQVHNMVDQGLLPAASTDPLRFRAEDVQAVRMQGG